MITRFFLFQFFAILDFLADHSDGKKTKQNILFELEGGYFWTIPYHRAGCLPLKIVIISSQENICDVKFFILLSDVFDFGFVLYAPMYFLNKK